MAKLNFQNKTWKDNPYLSFGKSINSYNYNDAGCPSTVDLDGAYYSDAVSREDVLKRIRKFIKAKKLA